MNDQLRTWAPLLGVIAALAGGGTGGYQWLVASDAQQQAQGSAQSYQACVGAMADLAETARSQREAIEGLVDRMTKCQALLQECQP